MPKSLRLIFVVAEMAVRFILQGSLIAALGPSTSSTTDFVTPWIVKSPVTLSFPAPAYSTFVDLNVKVGNLSLQKN